MGGWVHSVWVYVCWVHVWCIIDLPLRLHTVCVDYRPLAVLTTSQTAITLLLATYTQHVCSEHPM